MIISKCLYHFPTISWPFRPFLYHFPTISRPSGPFRDHFAAFGGLLGPFQPSHGHFGPFFDRRSRLRGALLSPAGSAGYGSSRGGYPEDPEGRPHAIPDSQKPVGTEKPSNAKPSNGKTFERKNLRTEKPSNGKTFERQTFERQTMAQDNFRTEKCLIWLKNISNGKNFRTEKPSNGKTFERNNFRTPNFRTRFSYLFRSKVIPFRVSLNFTFHFLLSFYP